MSLRQFLGLVMIFWVVASGVIQVSFSMRHDSGWVAIATTVAATIMVAKVSMSIVRDRIS